MLFSYCPDQSKKCSTLTQAIALMFLLICVASVIGWSNTYNDSPKQELVVKKHKEVYACRTDDQVMASFVLECIKNSSITNNEETVDVIRECKNILFALYCSLNLIEVNVHYDAEGKEIKCVDLHGEVFPCKMYAGADHRIIKGDDHESVK